MKKITGIRIIFDDTTDLILPEKAIGDIFIEDVHMQYFRTIVFGVVKSRKAETFAIEIFPDKTADISVKTLQQIAAKHNITGIDVMYETGGVENILVPWDLCDTKQNSYQTNALTRDNVLRIVISKNKVITDYFPQPEEST